MLRKRAGPGWSGYQENFSDLLEHQQEPPKRRKRFSKRKKHTISSFSQEIDEENSSDDDSFVVKQDGVIPLSEELFSSPVLRRSSIDSQIKSTPSGSPILLKSLQKTWGSSSNLIPISPITPGIHQNLTADKTIFSLHVSESTHERVLLDQTTLAVPLDVTEDEIEDDFTQLQDFSNKNENSPQEDESELWNFMDFESQELSEKPRNRLDKTGTSWIKTLQDKVDEEWRQKTEKLAQSTIELNQSISFFDSGRKDKFVKGGYAEQLSCILKKEKLQESVFLRRIKTGKIEKQKPESLVLKVLSNTREGTLHVIECKSVHSTKYYNLILPQDVATCLDLSLGCTIRIYPPFYVFEGSDKQSVLLSAYNLTIEEGHDLLSKSQNFSENSRHNESSSQSQNFESLLKCLEARSFPDEGISVITTIQRIFFRSINGDQWSLLCSDAYGTFFVIEMCIFDPNSDLTSILSHGEGQRVVFKDLTLCNRVKRSQLPALFDIVDSIWCSSGTGLMHVNSSQSQCSDEPYSLLPPSFCYFLRTEKNSQIIFPKIESRKSCESCGTQISVVSSDLNRPSMSALRSYDILYKPTDIFSLEKVTKSDFNDGKRFTLICRFSGTEDPSESQSQDLCCTYESSIGVTLCVIDCLANTGNISDSREILMKYSVFSTKNDPSPAECGKIWVKNPDLLPKNLSQGCVVVFKDVHKSFDKIYADNFTRIQVVSCFCEAEDFLKQEVSNQQ